MDTALFNELKSQQELDPYSDDGSYQLMKETVASFKQIDNAIIDVSDLDLIYLITINLGEKKQLIDKSHLAQTDKTRLKLLVDDLQGKNIHIGLFGTGFYTFKAIAKSDEVLLVKVNETARNIVGLCVRLADCEDENEAISLVENATGEKQAIFGIAASSLSQILHVLKPTFFPVLNSNSETGKRAYDKLDVQLIKPVKVVSTYARNARAIKEFRDKNFKFKNYMLIDRVAMAAARGQLSSHELYLLNVIFYGPPGTGKTYEARERADKIINGQGV